MYQKSIGHKGMTSFLDSQFCSIDLYVHPHWSHFLMAYDKIYPSTVSHSMAFSIFTKLYYVQLSPLSPEHFYHWEILL